MWKFEAKIKEPYHFKNKKRLFIRKFETVSVTKVNCNWSVSFNWPSPYVWKHLVTRDKRIIVLPITIVCNSENVFRSTIVISLGHKSRCFKCDCWLLTSNWDEKKELFQQRLCNLKPATFCLWVFAFGKGIVTPCLV